MKALVTSLLVGGSMVASTLMMAPAAHASCYNYSAIAAHVPTVCVGYDYCDADICINLPKISD